MDFDADGNLDLISGSWPGELFLFRGRPNRTFGPPEKIKDKNGKEINVGGGVRTQADGSILITGDAKFETIDGKTTVRYQGKTFQTSAETPIAVTGCASAVHAVDWDGDGDLDLLVGEISGAVHLIVNEGNAKASAFGPSRPLPAAGKPLRVEGDAGPFAADWDGDGKIDLLVGAGDGSVSFFRNTGTHDAPALDAAVRIVPSGEAAFGPAAPKNVLRGVRSKICVADWNGDGRLDLLVGDFAVQAPDLPAPTAEQKKEQDALRKQFEIVMKEYSETVDRIYGPKRLKDKEAVARANDELKEIRIRMTTIREKLPPQFEDHGWVWLFLRKPAAEDRK